MWARHDMRLAVPAIIVWSVIELPDRWLYATVALGCVLLVCAVGLYLCGRSANVRRVLAVSAIAATAAASTTLAHTAAGNADPVRQAYNTWVDVEASVSSHVDVDGEKYSADLSVASINGQRSHARLHMESTDPAWAQVYRGDEVLLRGSLQVPWGSNDGTLVVRELRAVQHASGLAGWARVMRQDMIATGVTGHRSLIPGVVVGDDTHLDPQLEESMRTLGLAHLTAVSGAHVSLVLGGVIAILGRRRARVTALVSAVALVVLVAIVGAEASVIRAVIMGTLICVALALRRPASAFPLLCATVIGVSLVDPRVASSLGMRLSVVATAAIVVFAYPLAARLSSRMPTALAQLLAVPIVAALATAPFLSGVQERASVWSVAANIAVAPVVAPLTIAGLAGGIALPFASMLGHLLLAIAALCTWWIDIVTRFFIILPGSEVSVLESAAVNLGVLVLIVAWTISWQAVSRVVAAVAAVVASAYGIAQGRAFLFPVIARDWEVVQCDVGQGSALIARREGNIVLVDTGKAGAGVTRCLSDANIDHVDLLVISHYDADHAGGVAEVLAQVSVDHAWLPTNDHPRETSADVLSLLDERGITWELPALGATYPNDENTFVTVIGPSVVSGYSDSTNDDSLALRISTPSYDTYALGDLPAYRQHQIAIPASRQQATGRRTAVVVAHHGARDQSEQLASALKPEVTLISVGDNGYGHPHEEALRIWAAPVVARTDLCGHIALTAEAVKSRCGG